MIKVLSWLAIVAVLTVGTAARGEERLLFLGGHGAIPCQEWTDLREAMLKKKKLDTDKTLLIWALQDWALGFISGISEGSAQGAPLKIEQTILCETNDADVMWRVDNFCRTNPSSRVYQAVLIVSADLVHDKAEQIRKADETNKLASIRCLTVGRIRHSLRGSSAETHLAH